MYKMYIHHTCFVPDCIWNVGRVSVWFAILLVQLLIIYGQKTQVRDLNGRTLRTVRPIFALICFSRCHHTDQCQRGFIWTKLGALFDKSCKRGQH